MIVPKSVTLRGRLLKEEELACYVPSYDGIVLEKSDYDPLVDEAETAHRLLALHTNIGNLAFAWDLQATILAETLIYAAATDGVLAGKFIQPRKEALSEFLLRINKLNNSYEVLDETFSAFMSYSAFKEHHVWPTKIKDLERALLYYPNPKISITFKRIQKLLGRYTGESFSPEVFSTLQGIFLDSASIPIEDINCYYDCDRRLEFLLTIAERGAENDVPIDQLRQYWKNWSNKAGYRIGQWGQFDSSLVTFLTNGVSNCFLDEGYFFKDAFKILQERYLSIIEARNQDRLDWVLSDRDTEKVEHDKVLVKGGKLPKHAFMDSSVRIVQEGEMLVLGTKITADPNAWGDFAFHTILRNAAVTQEQQCPLGVFEGEDGPLCAPIDDDRCILRKLRMILLSN